MVDIQRVKPPIFDNSKEPIILSDQTYQDRRAKILKLMERFDFSSLIIYADKEHGSNFEYLTGFIPRFEEGLQVLNQDGSSTLILGNENFNKTKFSRIESRGILYPLFSLPNQPKPDLKPLNEYLKEAQIDDSKRVGLVDWKLLTDDGTDFPRSSAVPAFIVDGVEEVVGADKLWNATAIYLDPAFGARTTVSAEEILKYEYGASLASDAVLSALLSLEEGMSELAAGDLLNQDGQYPSVVTIAAFGERFEGANIYPRHKKLVNGDKVALTVAYKGGLSSRSGYGVKSVEELEAVDPNYLKEVVFPYFEAYQWWLEQIKVGVNAGEFYDAFEAFYPQSIHGWELCPGHLVADEEWLSSPFYKGSQAIIRDGMIFQVDYIPTYPNHHGVSAESTVAIASEDLQQEIASKYPELWQRICARKAYLEAELGLHISKEALPLASTLGYYQPFMLNNDYAITYH